AAPPARTASAGAYGHLQRVTGRHGGERGVARAFRMRNHLCAITFTQSRPPTSKPGKRVAKTCPPAALLAGILTIWTLIVTHPSERDGWCTPLYAAGQRVSWPAPLPLLPPWARPSCLSSAPP